MTRSAADVRKDFIDFFKSRGHTFVPGSPVVPYDDPTLLFTNAGMNQFKDVFLATGTRSYNRAANSQPCIRAGGKHNDLDDVGQDTYHHTFFEMLGNWSFGDYFKKEAIEWAWELLTKVWGLDKTRLHATYFEGNPSEGLDPDNEAKELWASVTDIDPQRIHPGNKKDNFWEMGETGPCGPCSEVHIDLTPDKSGAKLVNAGDARVIEIWNLVFIQFNRDASGKLTPLPAKHVDTGMGFERVTALLQGKTSNYDTDVFTPIFEAIREITGAPPYRGLLPQDSGFRVQGSGEGSDAPLLNPEPRTPNPQTMIDVSYRVIADHARCLTFAINDGCMPDREGRGYVLRRILRRGVRYGWQYFNMHEPFLYKLVPAVVATLGDAFPQLKQKPDQVAEIIREEEQAFLRTLDRGIQVFRRQAVHAWALAITTENPNLHVRVGYRDESQLLPDNLDIIFVGPNASGEDFSIDIWSQDHATQQALRGLLRETPTFSGEVAFGLHDTYGFPIDLTQIMAEEQGLRVDFAEYERLMEDARERARGDAGSLDEWPLSAVPADRFEMHGGKTNDDLKYDTHELRAIVKAVFRVLPPPGAGLELSSGQASLHAGERGGVIVDRTCFYAEAGGQVGDQGTIEADGARFVVEETRRIGSTVLHLGTLRQGELKVGQEVSLGVDVRRRATMKNHTATHVMNWALREVLGDHVQQKGSLVDPEKTRFDFSHSRAVTAEEIEHVESLVNRKIGQNLTVYDEPVEQEQALKIHGLRAVFGEKYPDVVRVMSIGTPVGELVDNPDNAEWRNVSIEFCGGTHCQSTGQIGHFAIVSEEAVAKGIRRVVGITGEAAQAAIDRGAELLKQADGLCRVGTAHQDVAAGGSPAEVSGNTPTPQPGATVPHSPQPGATVPHSPQPGAAVPHAEADLAKQVAELQQAIADEALRVVDRAKLRDAIAELQRIIKKQQKLEAAAVQDVVTGRINELLAGAPKIGETTIFVAEMPDVPIDQLKTGADMIKQKCGSAAVLFGVRVGATERRSDEATKATADEAAPRSEPGASATGPSEPEAQARAQSEREAPARAQGKALLLAAMSNDLVKRGLKAGDLVKAVAKLVNGGGGGPPTMAQAGGKDPSKIPDALEAGRKWIEEKLA